MLTRQMVFEQRLLKRLKPMSKIPDFQFGFLNHLSVIGHPLLRYIIWCLSSLRQNLAPRPIYEIA